MKSGSKLLITLLTVSLSGLLACSQKGNGTARNLEDAAISIIGGKQLTAADGLSKSVVALVDVDEGALCTASIISENMLVTAAHCVQGNLNSMVVVFTTDLTVKDKSAIKVRTVESGIQTSFYAERQLEPTDEGDIALIKLSEKIPAGYVPATLLTDASVLKKGTTVTLVGYGIDDGVKQTGSGILRQTEVAVETPVLGQTEVLLNQKQGKGACHGDSGGPAYVLNKGQVQLFGVTSRGALDKKNDCSQYSIYTNLVPYKAWIEAATAELNKPAQDPTPVTQ
jgi:secreted trypsin-like serine protease